MRGNLATDGQTAAAARRLNFALQELQQDAIAAGMPFTAHLIDVAAETAADEAILRQRRETAERAGASEVQTRHGRASQGRRIASA